MPSCLRGRWPSAARLLSTLARVLPLLLRARVWISFTMTVRLVACLSRLRPPKPLRLRRLAEALGEPLGDERMKLGQHSRLYLATVSFRIIVIVPDYRSGSSDRAFGPD